jgi:hypothetical protein
VPSPALVLLRLPVRSALAQLDLPTRTAFMMALATPGERATAASLATVLHSLPRQLRRTLRVPRRRPAGWARR